LGLIVDIWEFPTMGVPKDGWFMMENPKMDDDWGTPHFGKPPYLYLMWVTSQVIALEDHQ